MVDPLVLRRYPGTKRFGEDPNWQTLFYGRDREADEFFNKVLDIGVFSVLHGVTGSGKSSFIRAGLGAEFKRRGITPIYLDLTKLLGAAEVSATSLLGSIFVNIIESLKLRVSTERVLSDLQELHEQDYVDQPSARLEARSVFRKLLKGGLEEEESDIKRQEFVIFLDQYDHLADKPADQQNMVQDVIHGLHDAADSEFSSIHTIRSVVLVVRSEYLRLLVPLSSKVPGVFSHVFELKPIYAEAAKECIVGPARRDQSLPDGRNYLTSHWSFDDELVDYIVLKATPKSGHGGVELLDLQRICSDIEEGQNTDYKRTIGLTGRLKATIDDGRRRYLKTSIKKAYKKYFGSTWRRQYWKGSSLFYGELCQLQKRRSIAEDVILAKLGNNHQARDFLEYLCGADMRILARLNDGVNMPRLSYTHDLLAETAETLRWPVPFRVIANSSIFLVVVVMVGAGFTLYFRDLIENLQEQRQSVEQALWEKNVELDATVNELSDKKKEVGEANESIKQFMNFFKESLDQTQRSNNKLLLSREFHHVSTSSPPEGSISMGRSGEDSEIADLEREIEDMVSVARYQHLVATNLVGASDVHSDNPADRIDCARGATPTDPDCKEYIRTTWAEKFNPTEKIVKEIKRTDFKIESMEDRMRVDDTVTVIGGSLYLAAKKQKIRPGGSTTTSDLSDKRNYVFEYSVIGKEAETELEVSAKPLTFVNHRETLEPNSLSSFREYLVVGANGGEVLFCRVKAGVCDPDVIYKHGNDEIIQIEIFGSMESRRSFLITLDSEGEIRASVIAQNYERAFIRTKPIFTIFTNHTSADGSQLFFTLDEDQTPEFTIATEYGRQYKLPYKKPNEFFNGPPPLVDHNAISDSSYYSAAIGSDGESVYFGRSGETTKSDGIEPLSIHWWRDSEGVRAEQKSVYQLSNFIDASDLAVAAGNYSEQPWRMTSFEHLNNRYIAMVTTLSRLILCRVLNAQGDKLSCSDALIDQSANHNIISAEFHDLVWDSEHTALLITSFGGQLIRVSFSESPLSLNLAKPKVNVTSILCSSAELEQGPIQRKVTAIALESNVREMAVALRALHPSERSDSKNCIVVAPIEWVHAQLDNDSPISNEPAEDRDGPAVFILKDDESVKTITWLSEDRMAYGGRHNLEIICTDESCQSEVYDIGELDERTYWKVEKVGDFLFGLHGYGIDIWHHKTGKMAVNYAYPIEDASYVKLYNRTVDFDVSCSEKSCLVAVPLRSLGVLVISLPHPDAPEN